MDDLISRQAAIEVVQNRHMMLSKEKVLLINDLEKLPSAQPEIIRCKDCGKREVCRTSTVWAVAPSDDWFCADAERREDG